MKKDKRLQDPGWRARVGFDSLALEGRSQKSIGTRKTHPALRPPSFRECGPIYLFGRKPT